MRSIVSDVTKIFCQGCIYDHPSQLEYDVCVMMPFEEHWKIGSMKYWRQWMKITSLENGLDILDN